MLRKFLLQASIIIIFLFIVGCESKTANGFPETEIVYEASRLREPSIGFINSDGTGKVEIKLDYYVTQPIWSSDKKTIYFWEPRGASGFVSTLTGFPYFWHERKGIDSCQFLVGWPIYPFPESEDLLISSGIDIRRVDQETCNEVRVYVDYSNSISPTGIAGLSLSRDGRYIVYSEKYVSPEKTKSKYKFSIKVFDIKTETISNLVEGVNPEFSPDHSWIAYTNLDGIYVMKSNGTQKQRIVDYDARDHSSELDEFEKMPPAPRWSPDSEWLVYHKCREKITTSCDQRDDYSIYKIQAVGGKEMKIIDGGLNPYWKSK